MTLDTALSEKYAIIENHQFSKRLLSDELTPVEYLIYLSQLQPIFNHIERYPLPFSDMARDVIATVDMAELRLFPGNLTNQWAKPLQTTFHYMQYLLKLSEQKTLPHMYINYMFLLVQGQDIKSKIHGTGRLYKFNNIPQYIETITSLKRDEWEVEANIALDYRIAILDEIQEVCELINT